MGVVTEQPGVNENQSRGYDEQQQPRPGYDGAYGQPSGAPPQGAAPDQQMSWMPIPANVPTHCPPGLEYLTSVDHMLVQQQIEMLEALVGVECTNKYRIANSLNQQVYFATEESEFCQRMWCKGSRGFTMHIWDNSGREVMRILRPFQCLSGCTVCADKAFCSLYIDIEAPVGQLIGRVKQTKSCLSVHFDVTSPDDDVQLKIRGPKCVLEAPCCTGDQGFIIFTPDLGTEIGRINKKWAGFFQEMFSNADTFGMSFPLDLDVKMKATLFGALFLIDFMYFENNDN